MTLVIPLDPAENLPTIPPFLSVAPDSEGRLNDVLKAIRKAKRITVVSGTLIPSE
jgi:hypothetical protein